MKDRLIREIGQEFSIISTLGKGAFGKVFECLSLSTNKPVALKVIKKYKLTEKQIMFSLQESKLLSQLKHPNIVNFISLHHTDSFLILEMELLKGKTLAELLSYKTLTEEEAANIMSMIFSGVSYLHKVQVLHRDLKPANIMFEDAEQTIIKITDFGLSTKYTLDERLHAQSGTMAYMAPEQMLQKQYSEPIDIWSCGIILYQLLTNSHPLSASNKSPRDYKKLLEHIEWHFPDSFPLLAKDLFLRCTRINPIERYTASLALKHPWITRTQGKIPLTPLEEQRVYQDTFKIKKIIMSGFFLVGIYSRLQLNKAYIAKINDPRRKLHIEIQKEIQPKKNSSLTSIDLSKTTKPFLTPREIVTCNYGTHLNVPGKKNVSAHNSPREQKHKRVSSSIISRSPSPNFVLPKAVSKPMRRDLHSN